MLVLQIAAGVVLAVLIVRFWRQALWLALGLAVLAGVVFLVLSLDQGRPGRESVVHIVFGVVLAAAALPWIIGRIQAWRSRGVIRESPEE